MVNPYAQFVNKEEPVESTNPYAQFVPQTQPEQEEVGFKRTITPAKIVKNIPGDIKNVASMFYQALRHPQDTKNAITGVLGGLIQKAIPGEQNLEPYVDSAWEGLKEEYGSLDAIQNRISEEPLQFAMDVTSLISGTGYGLKAAKLGKAGEKVLEVGKNLEPVNLLKKASVTPLKAVPTRQLERIIERAIKLPSKLDSKQKLAAIQSMLKHDITPTPSGYKKMNEYLDGINKKIDGIISSPKDYKQLNVKTDKIIESLDFVESEFADVLPMKNKYMEQLQTFKDEFKSGHGDLIPTAKAQKMKKKIYKLYQNAYGDAIDKTIDTASNKSIAYGIKTQLGRIFPEIKKLNEKSSEIVELKKALKNEIGNLSHRQMLNLGAGGSPIAMAKYPQIAIPAMLLKNMIGSPKVKTRLAIAINKGKKIDLKDVKAKGATVRQGLFESGQLKEKTDEVNEWNIQP